MILKFRFPVNNDSPSQKQQTNNDDPFKNLKSNKVHKTSAAMQYLPDHVDELVTIREVQTTRIEFSTRK